MIAILMCTAVWGCSGPAQFDARQNLDESQAQYAQCIATHGAGAMECASARQDYESSQRAYDQTESQTPTALRAGEPQAEQPDEFGGTH
jgi:hypothetical protein